MATVTAPPPRSPRRRPRPRRLPLWRRARRVLTVACLLCLGVAALSWVPAVTGSRNLGLGVASVEWLRSHGGNPIASQIENWYYELNEPEKGGPPLKSLPHVGVAAAGDEAGSRGEDEGEGEARPTHYEPANVDPLIHPKLPGEGIWQKAGAKVGPHPPVLLTTFRSDPEYPQFVAGVAWIDHARTELDYVPGLAEPPEPLEDRGNGEVPAGMRKRLVATFNGGFPLETSNAGLIYRGKVKETMVNGIATVVRYRDGRLDIVRWESGPGAPKDVWFAKQNLPPIIYEGKLNPNLGDGPEWGETVNNATRVWRSGLGIDAHGNLMYAAANYQTVESLAKVLQRAGAVRAIELDINEDWTSFISYRHPGALDPSNLLPEMYRSPERYLTPDERDFFAIYLKPGQRW
ncbi:MAG TPA: phosphodiester glycosidase family protein [Solirubrobacterales bacterium]|nr:phosphodiester glycosidase family protein [Solirubrobacterales bacterium]